MLLAGARELELDGACVGVVDDVVDPVMVLVTTPDAKLVVTVVAPSDGIAVPRVDRMDESTPS